MKTSASKKRKQRDQQYLDSIRDKQVLRAVTFVDRRKEQSKLACRNNVDDS